MNEIIEILVSEIIPNPEQPRKSIKKIPELAASMKEIGQISPISVFELSKEEKKKFKSKSNIKYMLSNGGERRWTAAKKLEWKTIKAIVENPNEYAMLAENIARDDLNLIEKMLAIEKIFKKKYGDDWVSLLSYQHLHNKNNNGKEEQQICRDCAALGLAPLSVYNYRQILQLSKRVQKRLLEKSEYFTDTAILKLSTLKEEQSQLEIIKRIIKLEMSGPQSLKIISKEQYDHLSPDERHWRQFLENWRKTFASVRGALDNFQKNKKDIPVDRKERFISEIEDLHRLADRAIKKITAGPRLLSPEEKVEEILGRNDDFEESERIDDEATENDDDSDVETNGDSDIEEE